MPRTISSAQTFLMKVVFPVVWVGGMTLGTFAAGLGLGTADGRAGPPPPAGAKWSFLAMLLVFIPFVYWTCVRLKRVAMTDADLHISNYLREIVVPLRDIDEVSENRWINIHPVTVRFKKRTELGYSIVFMPTTRLFAFFSSHPIVGELREAAARQQAIAR